MIEDSFATSDRLDHLILFRMYVSSKAAAKGKAVLEGVGLDSDTIENCFLNNPSNCEEAVQDGLNKWKDSPSKDFPPTWKVLIAAMWIAGVAQKHIDDLKAELSRKPV